MIKIVKMKQVMKKVFLESKCHPILGMNVKGFGLMYMLLFKKAKFRRNHNLSNYKFLQVLVHHIYHHAFCGMKQMLMVCNVSLYILS